MHDRNRIGYQTINVSYTNEWDYKQQGNYWSDHNQNGTYVIDQNNIDHYPFSQQVNINAIAVNPTALPTTISSPSTLPVVWVATLVVVILSVVSSLLLFKRHRKNGLQQ